MKSNKKINFLVLLLAFCTVFAVSACKKKLTYEDATDSDIKSVSVLGLESSYNVGGSIDFSNVKVSVKYGDNTVTFEANDITYDSTDTTKKVYLDTDGLYGATDLAFGSHQILCKLYGTKTTKMFQGKVINIRNTVNNFEGCTAEKYSLPEFIRTYKSNIAKTSSEDSFKTTSEVYTVGQTNYFKFLPELKAKLEGNNDYEVYTEGFASLLQLYLINGNNESLVGSEYYSFDNAKGIKFTEDAIGKTFKIKSTLEEEIVDESGNDFLPLSLVVKVEKGYNVYSALDLGILNLSKLNTTYDENQPWSSTNRKISEYNSNKYSVWWNGSGYTTVDYVDMWEDFLTEKGYTITDDMYDVEGVFIHGDITITKNDIPSQYFIVAAETTQSTQSAIGTLRDEAIIYNHPMASDFTFNGNYFTISLNPVNKADKIVSGRSISADGAIKMYDSGSTISFGHNKLFFFGGDICGDNVIVPLENPTGNLVDQNVLCPYCVTIKNVNSIGNCDLEETDANIFKYNAGALIFMEPSFTQAVIENCVVKKYMIAFDFDNFPGDEETSLSILRNCKTYDCFNTAVFNYECYAVEIRDCEFKRFGGPAIMAIGGHITGSNTKLYNNVVENYVDGTEAWFSINNGQMITNYLKALQIANNGVSGFGTRKVISDSAEHNGKMNLVYLTLSSSYLDSGAPHSYTSNVELYDGNDTKAKVAIRLEENADETKLPQERVVHEAFKQSAANAYAFAFVTDNCIGEIVPADVLGSGSPNICIDLRSIKGQPTYQARNTITGILANVQDKGLSSPYVYDGDNLLTGDYIAILATPEALSNTTIGFILEFAD